MRKYALYSNSINHLKENFVFNDLMNYGHADENLQLIQDFDDLKEAIKELEKYNTKIKYPKEDESLINVTEYELVELNYDEIRDTISYKLLDHSKLSFVNFLGLYLDFCLDLEVYDKDRLGNDVFYADNVAITYSFFDYKVERQLYDILKILDLPQAEERPIYFSELRAFEDLDNKEYREIIKELYNLYLGEENEQNKFDWSYL